MAVTQFYCLLLLSFLAMTSGLTKGKAHMLTGDSSPYGTLLIDSTSQINFCGFITYDSLYILPAIGASKPLTFPLVNGMASDVAYLGGGKLYLAPHSTPNRLVVADCQAGTYACTLTVLQNISLPVPSTTKWKTIQTAPATGGELVVLIADDYLVQVFCSSSCSNPKAVAMSTAPSSSSYKTVTTAAAPKNGFNDGHIFIFREGTKTANQTRAPGQILDYDSDARTLSTVALILSSSPVSMVFLTNLADITVAWTQTIGADRGSVNMYDVADTTGHLGQYTVIPMDIDTEFTTGAVTAGLGSTVAFLASGSASSSGYSVNVVDVNSQAASSPLHVSSDAVPHVSSSLYSASAHVYFVGTKSSGTNKLQAFLSTSADFSAHKSAPRPNVTHSSARDPCTDPAMPPTCYMSCKQGTAVCGLRQKCPSGSSCYILAEHPDCCTYCPSEWSGNC